MTRWFWYANAAIVLDEIVYLALLPLLPTYAEEFGLSASGAGVLFAAYPVCSVLSSVPGGRLVDRLGAPRVLVFGLALFVAATLAFALADGFTAVLAARSAQGLAAGVTATAGMAAIAAGAPAGSRGATIGIAVAVQSTSTLFGPLLGGVLVPAVGAAAFAIPGVLAAVLATVAVLAPGQAPARARLPQDPQAVRRALRSRDVRAAVAIVLAVGITGGAVSTLTPLRLEGDGYGPEALALVFVAAAVLGLGGPPLAGWLSDRLGLVRVTRVWGLIVLALVLGLVASEASPWLTIALFVVFLDQPRIGGMLAYARGARYAPLGGGLGTGYGLAITFWSVGAAVGPLLAGAMSDAAGETWGYLAAVALAGVLLIPAVRRDRGETASTHRSA